MGVGGGPCQGIRKKRIREGRRGRGRGLLTGRVQCALSSERGPPSNQRSVPKNENQLTHMSRKK